MAFTYNPNTHYPIGETAHYNDPQKAPLEDYTGVFPTNEIQVNSSESFSVKFPDDFLSDDEYLIKLGGSKMAKRLLPEHKSDPDPDVEQLDKIADDYENTDGFQFYQNQINFAVWCATSGCGVSSSDHLQHKDKFIRSLYRFHVYYQVLTNNETTRCSITW